LNAALSASGEGLASLGHFGEKGVHRGEVAVAFEDHGERAGGTRGGFFEEVEDGIGNVVEVIIEEAFGAVGRGDEPATCDVHGGNALRWDLAHKLEGVKTMIKAVGEDIVKIKEQAAI
jgi:hypothetical protein